MYIVNEVTCVNEPSFELPSIYLTCEGDFFLVGPTHTYGCFLSIALQWECSSSQWSEYHETPLAHLKFSFVRWGFIIGFEFLFPTPRLVDPSSSKVERQIIHFATSMCLDHIPSNKRMYIYICS